MATDPLTPEQRAQFQPHIDSWMKVATCTDPADFDTATKEITKIYELMDCAPPVYQFMKSGPAAVITGCLAEAVINKLGVDADPSPELIASTIEEVAQTNPWRQDYNQYFGGQFWTGWASYVSFCRDICKHPLEDKLDKLSRAYEEVTRSVNWWWVGNHVCVISDRPCKMFTFKTANGDIRYHKDGDAALEFRDGFALYFLHGVLVPDWLALTPAEKLDPQKLTDITNAEVRREFVQKIGIDILERKLGSKSLDKDGDYEVVLLNLSDGRDRPYLKMRNPSIDTWHLEGVPPDIKTVKAAILWRNQIDQDSVDDKNGADFYQQGDVILKPVGAKKFKSRPIKLT